MFVRARLDGTEISIHTLRMEGDLSGIGLLILANISIHTLRMEGDQDQGGERGAGDYFNPHPPHGG